MQKQELDDQLGFSDYFAIIKRRRRLLISLGVPIVLIAIVLAFSLPKLYQSLALIEIQKGQSASLMREEGGEREYIDKYVRSLADRAYSYQVMESWAKELKPYPELAGDVSEAAGQLRRDLAVDIVTTKIMDPSSGADREVISAFTVSAMNRDPAMAYKIAQKATTQILSTSRDMGSEGAGRASTFLATEAERYRGVIAETEEKLAEFKRKNFGNLPELNDVNVQLMERNEGEMQNLQLQMQSLRRERVVLLEQLQQTKSVVVNDQQLAELEQELRTKAATYDPTHPDVVALRRQIDILRAGGGADSNSLAEQLKSKRSVLTQSQQRYSADHPDIKRLQREIQTLEARIAKGETVETVGALPRNPMYGQLQARVNGVDSDLAALMSRMTELQNRSREFEKRLQTAPEVEREYQDLTRNLTLAREKYGELLKQQMEADVSKAAISGGAADEFRIVEEARLPTSPAKPARMVIIAVGLFLAIGVAFSTAIGAEMVDPHVRGARDVVKLLNIAPLATVPRIENSLSVRARSQFAFGLAAACLLGSGLLFTAVTLLT